MDKLLNFLETSDFFTAPASTKFHLAYEGGLAEHSWNVYTIFNEKLKTYSLEFGKDSIALCGLLHDICKTNFYVRGKKNVKEDGKWIEKEVWMVKDSLPFGHGEKSVYLLQKYIELSDEEALTIRWHMGFTESQDAWEQLRQATKNILRSWRFISQYGGGVFGGKQGGISGFLKYSALKRLNASDRFHVL